MPRGWVAEPVGEWAGRPVEVAYDVRRHQVLLVRAGAVDTVAGGLGAGGWECVGADGGVSMWVRDRLVAVRDRMSIPHTAGPGADVAAVPVGPSL